MDALEIVSLDAVTDNKMDITRNFDTIDGRQIPVYHIPAFHHALFRISCILITFLVFSVPIYVYNAVTLAADCYIICDATGCNIKKYCAGKIITHADRWVSRGNTPNWFDPLRIA